MRFFADASFIVPLYRESRFSKAALEIVEREFPRLLLTPVTRWRSFEAWLGRQRPRRKLRAEFDI